MIQEKEGGGNCNAFNNRVSGVPLRPLHHVLFVGSDPLSSATLSEWGGGLAPPLEGRSIKEFVGFFIFKPPHHDLGIIKFYFIAHFTLFSLYEYLYYF